MSNEFISLWDYLIRMRSQEEIGNYIASLCKAKNLNKTNLSEVTGLATKTIGRIISGESEGSMDSMWKISRALSVSLYDILGEPEDPTIRDVAVFLNAFERATIEARKEAMDILKKSREKPDKK